MALLEVKNLNVLFNTNDGVVRAVSELSFSLEAGDSLAVVGESGSGKSQTAFAIMGLLARNGHATGSVAFEGREILNLSNAQMNKVRSDKIAMIFQDPMTSLNPYLRVSTQLTEVLIQHKGLGQKEALAESVRMLDAVKIPEAKGRINMYPHEFSGGMRQRVMIAMALLCRPKLLIADEPTTALDVTVQAQIMALLHDIQKDFGTAMILITHDLGVVAGSSERTLVLYGGRVMESNGTDALFETPTHPYTRGLMLAIPRVDQQGEELTTIPGDPPNMMTMPTGCPFSPRCPNAIAICTTEIPQLQIDKEGRARACHLTAEEVS